MIYTKKKVPKSNYDLAVLAIMAPYEEILLFDIETTGFSRISDSIVSITAAEITIDSIIVHQWFAESPQDEKEILSDFNHLQDLKPYHVTYNGDSFDIPFLYCKYQHYNIFTTLNKCKSCDLYRVSKKALSLDSYKLKAIEKALDIQREDTISGKECVELYRNFLNSKDFQLANLILQHNFEDVLNLLHVSKVLAHLSEADSISLIPIKWSIGSYNWYLASISIKAQILTLVLEGFRTDVKSPQPADKQFYLSNGDLLKLVSSKDHSTIEISTQIVSHELEGLQYDFYNSDSQGLASILKIDSSLEKMLCRYGSQYNLESISRIVSASILNLLSYL